VKVISNYLDMKAHWIAVTLVGVMIVGTLAFSAINAQGQYSIPSWVKGVAGFWAEDKITDADFGEALSFLISEGIIKIPEMELLKQKVVELESKIPRPNYVNDDDDDDSNSLPPPSTQSSEISLSLSNSSFEEGDTIVISGKVSTIIFDTPMSIQIFNQGNLVEIVQLVVAQDGSFTHTIIAQGPQWQNEGDYTVRAAYGEGNIAEANFEFFKQPAMADTSDFFEVDAGSSGTFDVEYTIRGGTVKDMIVNLDLFALTVIIESAGDGSLTLDLPRESIDAKKSDGSDDLFVVLIDGIEVIYDEAITNENTRTLTITFEEGDSDIEIMGTFIIN